MTTPLSAREVHRYLNAEGEMRTCAALPEDLLYDIAFYFDYDISNLRVLNRLSRAFHHATRELLYRHFDTVLPQNVPRILRSVDKNAKVAALIKS